MTDKKQTQNKKNNKSKVTSNKTSTKAIKKEIKELNKLPKPLKICVITLICVLCIGALAYSGYYLYQNGYFDSIIKPNPDIDDNDDPNSDKKDGFDNSSPNVSTLISNNEYSISSSSVFYQYNKEEIINYYKDIDFSIDKETISLELFNLLKTNQVKLNYDGKNSLYSNTNYTWANYCLVDRNYLTSPLTKEEVSKNGWNRYVNMDILYQKEDFLFPTSNNVTGLLDREHIFPKSYGFNGSNDAYKNLFAGTDLHNLRSSDHNSNSSSHSDRFYDDVYGKKGYQTVTGNDNSSKTYYIITYDKNGNKIGFFEPCEEDKGDIARSVFYMAIRYKVYESNDSIGQESPALILLDDPIAKISSTMTPSQTKNNPAEFGVLSTLKRWNEEDPVDEFEMTRNNLVYNLQKNRNPFVDYPELVNYLF